MKKRETCVHIHFCPHKVVTRQRERKAYLDSGSRLLLPPNKSVKVKKAVMRGADELARGLSLTEKDRQPRMTPEFFPGCLSFRGRPSLNSSSMVLPFPVVYSNFHPASVICRARGGELKKLSLHSVSITLPISGAIKNELS